MYFEFITSFSLNNLSYLVLVPLSMIFRIFHDVLKSDLCSFLFVAAFDISRNHSKQAFYLSKHHHRQMITYKLWELDVKKALSSLSIPFIELFFCCCFLFVCFFSIPDKTPALLMFLPIL